MAVNLLLKFGPYAAIALLFWLWIGAREDLAAEREACNASKLSAIAEAERVTAQTERAAFEARIAQLERSRELADEARAIAERARAEAESRPERVREVIRRVADENLCMDLVVPESVTRELRGS